MYDEVSELKSEIARINSQVKELQDSLELIARHFADFLESKELQESLQRELS
jgi:archaellum component FlaC